jgi:hypothetical protein
MSKNKLYALASALFFLVPFTLLAQVSINVELIPDVAKPGDTVTMVTALANLTKEPQVFEVWYTIKNPWGVTPKVIGPFPMKLAPGEKIILKKAFVIPKTMKPGKYAITGYCGKYPKGAWSYDTAILTIL